MNTLYYGDNLKILREYIKDESVDLVYLDPPFNSNRNYNVLFRDESGVDSESQITAFEDTWHWNASAEETYHELIMNGDEVARMIESFRSFIGNNQMMAYLVMMAVRLKELHRVLKPTGSLYLHCDPTASHYLKILLDAIFGAVTFRNELIWIRTSAHSSANRYGGVHDTIFFYSKSDNYTWNKTFTKYSPEYVEMFFDEVDEEGKRYKRTDLTGAGIRNGDSGKPWRGIDVTAKGRHWAVPVPIVEKLIGSDAAALLSTQAKLDLLVSNKRIHLPQKEGGMPRLKQYPDDLKGIPLQDVISDIRPLHNLAAERMGYPTQKPVDLLERLIAASSNEGDVVLDPFCGCGTTIAAAQRLNRQWIGIDITHLSIALQKYRLKDAFGLEPIGQRRSEPPALEGGQATANNAVSASSTDSPTASQPPAHAGGSDLYRIVGEPEDLNGAKQLASEDRYQFQWWALSLIKARPLGAASGSKQGKKGSDKGIDGVIPFIDDNSGKAKRALVQVKSGHVKSGDIRDLKGTLDREKAQIGIFLTLEKPSRDMLTEAVASGYFHSDGWHKDYPKIQILTVEELLTGKQVDMPPSGITFKQAEKVQSDISIDQRQLGFD
ncbi:MAG TPA: DNA methyltransferase [Pyrinomonadaceae bacterium]|nr:DNA methyltransferase [Pyrinomonadaceae bacterium]